MEYSSCGEGEEEEPSALDYARREGLSKPYYSDQFFFGNMPSPPRDDFDQDLWDLSPASITNTMNSLTKERLSVNRDAALLLKIVHNFREPPPEELLSPSSRRSARGLKQELPVLRTDNELDMLYFGCVDMPDLTKLKIPFEVVNQANDEGFEWPAKYLTYPARCVAQINAEKLAMPRDVLLYLQDAIRDSHAQGDFEKLKEECLSYRPVRASRKPEMAC